LRPNKKRALEMKIDKFYDLKEVLRESDFIFIAIPATKQTENLINKQTLDLMKKTAYLINIARPQIINTLDLAESIYNKKIA
jgi:lactate dehydrogenase-like 2-hydroxyacid dehydrogenase